MAGNILHWTADCYHFNYKGAPSDGSPWTDAGCAESLHVVRGGSWRSDRLELRSAHRGSIRTEVRLNAIGFRVALYVEAIIALTIEQKAPPRSLWWFNAWWDGTIEDISMKTVGVLVGVNPSLFGQ